MPSMAAKGAIMAKNITRNLTTTVGATMNDKTKRALEALVHDQRVAMNRKAADSWASYKATTTLRNSETAMARL